MPFNIGPGELVIVLIIALLVLGPGKLPEVGSALGKGLREFRNAASDVKQATAVDMKPADAPPPAAAPTAPVPPVAAVTADAPVEAPAEPPAESGRQTGPPPP